MSRLYSRGKARDVKSCCSIRDRDRVPCSNSFGDCLFKSLYDWALCQIVASQHFAYRGNIVRVDVLSTVIQQTGLNHDVRSVFLFSSYRV